MHLKYSNGSRQSSHLQDALQAVDPNSLIIVVCFDPQRGQAIAGFPSRSRLLADSSGGAMPYFRNFSRPESLIQSVVHGGVKMRFIDTSRSPLSRKPRTILSSITSVAGQPE